MSKRPAPAEARPVHRYHNAHAPADQIAAAARGTCYVVEVWDNPHRTSEDEARVDRAIIAWADAQIAKKDVAALAAQVATEAPAE